MGACLCNVHIMAHENPNYAEQWYTKTPREGASNTCAMKETHDVVKWASHAMKLNHV